MFPGVCKPVFYLLWQLLFCRLLTPIHLQCPPSLQLHRMSRLPSAHFLQISRVVLTGFDLLFDFKKCQFSCKLKTEIKPFRPILTEIVAVCFHFLFNSFVFYLFDVWVCINRFKFLLLFPQSPSFSKVFKLKRKEFIGMPHKIFSNI